MSKTATWIARLRGVNVGGRNRLPMASLVPELEKIGRSPMQSYLQSGSLLFAAPVSQHCFSPR
ncbi:DUF1697 domain-containing protein [Methylacidimicrobium sp. B4]|uniref:DUF1697 domain-containing protein n=1 Tax=Methylacidimicrobium sp. B4 TaxID=2796139 RepID=UPI001A8D8EC3|nr:DUF1697 domain-containing protein [Methylacidimicrobium sp. B4]QSR84923.1 DUF1697 domain-containing protein [Methylacidimicrobium sp. B4]